jgi:hypothetical protein
VPGPNEKPLYTAEPVTLEDLQLLADLFYLPYEHGPKGAQMLREFQWLRANSSVVSVNCKGKDSEKVSVLNLPAADFFLFVFCFFWVILAVVGFEFKVLQVIYHLSHAHGLFIVLVIFFLVRSHFCLGLTSD